MSKTNLSTALDLVNKLAEYTAPAGIGHLSQLREILVAAGTDLQEIKQEMSQTNWKTVKEGTPVLFRRNTRSPYEKGYWLNASKPDGFTQNGQFCWNVVFMSHVHVGRFGSKVSDSGEFLVNPFALKLA